MSLDGLLIHKVDIVHRHIGKDATGGKVDDFTNIVAADVDCRIEPNASPSKTRTAQQQTMATTHRIYFQQDLDSIGVTVQCRIVFRAGNNGLQRDRVFEYLGVTNFDELNEVIRVDVREFTK